MRMNVSFGAWPLIISRDELHYGLDTAEKAPAGTGHSTPSMSFSIRTIVRLFDELVTLPR